MKLIIKSLLLSILLWSCSDDPEVSIPSGISVQTGSGLFEESATGIYNSIKDQLYIKATDNENVFEIKISDLSSKSTGISATDYFNQINHCNNGSYSTTYNLIDPNYTDTMMLSKIDLNDQYVEGSFDLPFIGNGTFSTNYDISKKEDKFVFKIDDTIKDFELQKFITYDICRHNLIRINFSNEDSPEGTPEIVWVQISGDIKEGIYPLKFGILDEPNTVYILVNEIDDNLSESFFEGEITVLKHDINKRELDIEIKMKRNQFTIECDASGFYF